MSPQSISSFQFSARCLTSNSLGVPVHYLDFHGCNRATDRSEDIAGMKAAVSPGFGHPIPGTLHLMAAPDAMWPTTELRPFHALAKLVLDLVVRPSKLLSKKAVGPTAA